MKLQSSDHQAPISSRANGNESAQARTQRKWTRPLTKVKKLYNMYRFKHKRYKAWQKVSINKSDLCPEKVRNLQIKKQKRRIAANSRRVVDIVRDCLNEDSLGTEFKKQWVAAGYDPDYFTYQDLDNFVDGIAKDGSEFELSDYYIQKICDSFHTHADAIQFSKEFRRASEASNILKELEDQQTPSTQLNRAIRLMVQLAKKRNGGNSYPVGLNSTVRRTRDEAKQLAKTTYLREDKFTNSLEEEVKLFGIDNTDPLESALSIIKDGNLRLLINSGEVSQSQFSNIYEPLIRRLDKAKFLLAKSLERDNERNLTTQDDTNNLISQIKKLHKDIMNIRVNKNT